MRKMPVTIVYLLFLSVQVLFNLDIRPQPSVSVKNELSQEASHPPELHGWKIKLDKKPGKSTTPLNKRFEPSGIPGFPAFDIHTPVVYVLQDVIGTGFTGIYTSVCLHKHTLRGPPPLSII